MNNNVNNSNSEIFIFIKSFNYYNPTHQFKGFSYNSDGSMNAVYECKNGMLDFIPILGDPMFNYDITPRIRKIAGNDNYYVDSTGIIWRKKNGNLFPVRYNIRGGSYNNNMHYYFKTEIYNDINGGIHNEDVW